MPADDTAQSCSRFRPRASQLLPPHSLTAFRSPALPIVSEPEVSCVAVTPATEMDAAEIGFVILSDCAVIGPETYKRAALMRLVTSVHWQ